MKIVSLSTFASPHQYKLVKARSSAVVYEFIIPRGYIAFIDQVANTYFPNTYLTWVVDSEEETVEREIAPIDVPKKYDPPIIAKNYIRWIAYNNDTEDHLFEVICDGYLLKVD
jgi:hypothetical protein